ncbi:hypothetical protein MJO28_017397 [Puccinia striiformis f. sp. tritici]|nr:hypothetical protein MJO28_017397 [Puccinia striiformis f. sp. tritici]
MGCRTTSFLSHLMIIFIATATTLFSLATRHELLLEPWTSAAESMRDEINFDELDTYLSSVNRIRPSHTSGQEEHLEMTPTRPGLLSPSHQAQGRLSKLPYEFSSPSHSHQSSQTGGESPKRGEKRHLSGDLWKTKQNFGPGVATQTIASDHLNSYASNQFLESSASPQNDLTFEELQLMWDELDKFPSTHQSNNQEGHPPVINSPLPELSYEEEPGHVGSVVSPRMAASLVPRKRQRLSESLSSGGKLNVNFLTSILPETVFSVMQHDRLKHGTFDKFWESCSKAHEETNPVVDSSKNVDDSVLPTHSRSSEDHQKTIPDSVNLSPDPQIASSDSIFPFAASPLGRSGIQKSSGESRGRRLRSQNKDSTTKKPPGRSESSGVSVPIEYGSSCQSSSQSTDHELYHTEAPAGNFLESTPSCSVPEGSDIVMEGMRDSLEPKSPVNDVAQHTYKRKERILDILSQSAPPDPSKTIDKIGGISHSVLDSSQPKYPRLSFDKSMFSYKGSLQEYQLQAQKIIVLIELKKKGRLMLKPSEIGEVIKILRVRGRSTQQSKKVPTDQNQTRSRERISLLREKRTGFETNEHVWYTYWNDQTKIDFKKYSRDNITSDKLQSIFSPFLYNVEMLTTIFPRKEEHVAYKDELERAAMFFVEKAKFLCEHVIEETHGGKLKSKERDPLSRSDKLAPTLLWSFLESWMKLYYNELWCQMSIDRSNAKTVQSDQITRQTKGVINTFFTYSIDELTQHYKKLIDQTDNLNKD